MSFLQLPLADVEYLKVVRSADWTTTIEPVTDDLLGTVAESAEAIGLPPVALIQLTRAWLVVEGEHDRKILDAFYRRELRQAGICAQVLPLRGAARAKASFMTLEALAPLAIPFFLLLDDTRIEPPEGSRAPHGDRTEEEFIAEQLAHFCEKKGIRLERLSWPYPDIICALPNEAMRALAAESGGAAEAATSWSDLIEGHRRAGADASDRGRKAPDFKRFVLETLGLGSWSADSLVEKAIALCEDHPPQACPLSSAISHLLATVAEHPFDTAKTTAATHRGAITALRFGRRIVVPKESLQRRPA